MVFRFGIYTNVNWKTQFFWWNRIFWNNSRKNSTRL